jgi:hypothetical protein
MLLGDGWLCVMYVSYHMGMVGSSRREKNVTAIGIWSAVQDGEN